MIHRPTSDINDVQRLVDNAYLWLRNAKGHANEPMPESQSWRERTRYASILEEFQKSSYLRGNETDSKDEAGTDNRDPDSDSEEDHAMIAHEENTVKVYEASALPKPQSTTIRTLVTPNGNSTMNSDESGDLAKTGDVVDRGIISMDTAMTLVAVYMTKLVQHFPAVILSEYCTASELRVAKLVLFLAVVAAASLGGDSMLSLTLHKEIIRVYADRIVIKGEKSFRASPITACDSSILLYFRLSSASAVLPVLAHGGHYGSGNRPRIKTTIIRPPNWEDPNERSW